MRALTNSKTACLHFRIHLYVAFMESVWLLWACTAEAGDDMMHKAWRSAKRRGERPKALVKRQQTGMG